MKAILVDTDVISYLFNRHSLAPWYEAMLVDKAPLLSMISGAEMSRGDRKRKWGERRRSELEAHLRQFGLVPFDREVCSAYAEVRLLTELKGRPMTTADALIAATAFSLNVPLLTNNRKHFEGIPGLVVVSAITFESTAAFPETPPR